MTTADSEVLRAVQDFRYDDQSLAQMVFWWLTDFATSQEDSDVVDEIETFLTTFIGRVDQSMSDTITLEEAQVHQMQWNPAIATWETIRFLGAAVAGNVPGGATDLLPRQSAPVLIANTGRPKTRGRKFIPGFCEDSQQGGELFAPFITALGLALNDYLSDLTISAGNLLIAGVASVVTGGFEPFTDGAVNSILGTQRRRKQGVGA